MYGYLFDKGGLFEARDGAKKSEYGDGWPSLGRGAVTHPYTLRQLQEEDFLASVTLPIPIQEAEKLIRYKILLPHFLLFFCL